MATNTYLFIVPPSKLEVYITNLSSNNRVCSVGVDNLLITILGYKLVKNQDSFC